MGEQTIEEKMVAAHEIVLTIPAQPEFLRLARLAAADVGSRCGLAYEEVDDLRIAVDELCHAIMGPPSSDPGPSAADSEARTLEIRFTILGGRGSDAGIAIEATCASRVAPQLNELSAAILAAVVDEHELSGDDGGFNHFRMVKHVRYP